MQGSQPGIAPQGELRAAVKSDGMMEIVQAVTIQQSPLILPFPPADAAA